MGICSCLCPCSYLKPPCVFFIKSGACNSVIRIRKVVCLSECSPVIRKCMDNVFTHSSSTFSVVSTCPLPSPQPVRQAEVKLMGKWRQCCRSIWFTVSPLVFYLISLFFGNLPVAPLSLHEGGFSGTNMCVLTSDGRSEPV